jgi:hypothetical protein
MTLQFEVFTAGNRQVYDALPESWAMMSRGNEHRFTVPRDSHADTVCVNLFPSDRTSSGKIWLPYILGTFKTPPGPHEWKALEYPGPLSSPLGMWIEPETCHAIYDIDSRPCRVMYDGRGIRLEYKPEPGETIRFAAYPASGWRQVVNEYRTMLIKRDGQAQVLVLAGDCQHVGLQNFTAFDPDAFRRQIEAAAIHAPNVLLWGWMSNYAGPPKLAVPPIEPGEQVGCCLYRVEGHKRYAGIAASIAVAKARNPNIKVFPYIRAPHSSELKHVQPMMTAADRTIGVNPGSIGDGYYFDEAGRRAYPGTTPRELGAAINRWGQAMALLVEGANECQRVPALVAGAYNAAGGDVDAMRIGRAIQPDRQMYFGHSNGDHTIDRVTELDIADQFGLGREINRPTWLV